MKRFIFISLILAVVFGTVYAQDRQIATSDADRKVYWVPPYDITTITANTAITKGILAITPETDVNVYFGTDTTNDFLLEAYCVFAIDQSKDVKLKTETVCLVY